MRKQNNFNDKCGLGSFVGCSLTPTVALCEHVPDKVSEDGMMLVYLHHTTAVVQTHIVSGWHTQDVQCMVLDAVLGTYPV